MELIRRYSNRGDIWEDLEQAKRSLVSTTTNPQVKRQSVSSSGRVGKIWALRDRLSEEDVRGIAEMFRGGAAMIQIAKQYGVSESSVKRILRQVRAAGLVVQRETRA